MEKEIATWNRKKDDQLQLLKEIWANTDPVVQRRFLTDYINSNFKLIDQTPITVVFK